MMNRPVGLNYYPSFQSYLNMPPEINYNNNYSDWYELRNLVEPNGNEMDTFTSICFDSNEEMIWGGLSSGRVIGYLSPSLHKYVSIEGHTSHVKQLLPFENGIISISSESLRIHSKGGVSKCSFYDYQIIERFNCAAFTSKSKEEFLLAGEGEQVLLFDVETATPKSYVTTSMNNIYKIAAARAICFGGMDGKVGVYDSRSYREMHSLQTHSGGLYDIDLKGDLLITCGLSSLRGGKYYIDPYIKVFDIRTLRQLNPISYPSGPFQVKFHPKFSSTLVVISQSGYFQFCDIQGDMSKNNRYYQVSLSTDPGLSCFDISSSGESMCFGEMNGIIRQWADREHFNVHDFSKTMSIVDRTPPVPPIKISLSSPLSAVPKPDFESLELSSDWQPDSLFKVGRPVAPIDPSILKILNVIDYVGYAQNATNKKRNQDLSQSNSKALGVGSNILSSQSYPMLNRNNYQSYKPKKIRPPKMFRKIDSKKFTYTNETERSQMINKTIFAGLWNHHPNSYCNSYLQVLYFIPQIRKRLKEHICTEEFCISCELGFLYHNLDIAFGIACPNGNFLRSLLHIPYSATFGLLISDHFSYSDSDQFSDLIERFNTFLLNQINSELTNHPLLFPTDNNDNDNDNQSKEKSFIKEYFSHSFEELTVCSVCNYEKLSSKSQFSISLHYSTPSQDPSVNTFIHLLQSNIHSNDLNFILENQSFCPKCKINRELKKKTSLLSLPSILSINTNLTIPKYRDLFYNIQILSNNNNDNVNNNGNNNGNNNINNDNGNNNANNNSTKNVVINDGKDIVVTITNNNSTKEAPVESNNNNNNNNINNEKKNLVGLNKRNTIPRYIGFRSITNDNNNNNENGPLQSPYNVFELTKKQVSEIIQNNFKIGDERVEVYELTALTSSILDRSLENEDDIPPHFISHIKIPSFYFHHKQQLQTKFSTESNNNNNNDHNHDTNTNNDNKNRGEWYLFNDLMVTKANKFDVFKFDVTYRTPSIITYQKINLINEALNFDQMIEKSVIDERVFHIPNPLHSYALNPPPPLILSSLPKKGDIVAIDTEFVSLSPPLVEVRPDGKSIVIVQERSSLARVSVLWSLSHTRDELLIDDYIATREPVFNYLTRFSGITAGDLDPTISQHNVVPLKYSYLKLRYLVDIGCKFVGHGLKKDFQIINLIVPKDNVYDTVELYHLSHQRMISLRFLMSYLLKKEIQLETHCSIEDARAALHLYYHYQDLATKGTVIDTINEIYSHGRSINWKLPSDTEEELDESVTASTPNLAYKFAINNNTKFNYNYNTPHYYSYHQQY